MLQLRRTYSRPNTFVLWHGETIKPPKEFKDRIETYKTSGKIISSDFELSQDLLELTFIMIFDNEQSYLEYDNDPLLQEYWEIRKKYNDDSGIMMGPKELTTLN